MSSELPNPYGKQGKLFILSGPAGSGKTTLIDRLHEEYKDIKKNISFTTRPKRESEQEGKDYFFVSDEEFKQREEEGDFLETVSLFGHRYGTSKKWVESQLSMGHHLFLVIDTHGAQVVRRLWRTPSIFLKPPSLEVLQERLVQRETEDPQELKQRLEMALHEIEQASHYDYIVVNDQLDVAFLVLKSIVIAELHRRQDGKKDVNERTS